MHAIQGHLNLPYIPTEVIHDIIDKLPTDDSDCNSTWSDLALVSRCCRNRVNLHRFSKLEGLHPPPHRSKRLEALAWLLDSNVWQPQEGVSQHIQTVSLMLGQNISGEPPFLRSRDIVISKILMNLFKGSGNTLSYHDPPLLANYRHRQLVLALREQRAIWHFSGLSFDTLGSETIAALRNFTSSTSDDPTAAKNVEHPKQSFFFVNHYQPIH